MAHANVELIRALRDTAERLRKGAEYAWGHFGNCNCGHLARTLTDRSPAQIHAAALLRGGEWVDRAREWCPTSGYPVDEILREMFAKGLSVSDVADLERLDNPEVLARLPSGRRHLAKNVRDDLVEYLEAWAELLTAQLRRG